MTTLHDKAVLFGSLHTGGEPLVLANAWDVASALLVEEAGAKAVATTSAGVAWSLGAPDGDRLDRDRALGLVAGVAAAVDVPVTADIESGFGEKPEDVADTVRGVLEAGAVGVNIEDTVRGASRGLRPVEEQAARLAAARAAADAAGIPLYINARVDVYGHPGGDPETRLRAALDRAAAYLAAGASGIFVPFVTDPGTVEALVQGVGAPLNILAGPGAPAVGELAALGVARVSTGSSVAVAAYAVARQAARELYGAGTYGALSGELTFGELNALMSDRGQ
ncbi:isocitrate lyase/PEP mutase family protein [Planomonospora venezuelensis]|uniref:2-methylisocitrate lyase-like PEP mutase family enzyme n=1 Tax=Planomonospora venezuelensis TaxID=1999 RepID=A0A841CVW1_PLAVE|nr:isocitrate lyase/phosphoenolpyruvate mutase family protein [Planomonospora venezuelensis]MBB5962041.1 2-methylisocitrate lyase-like PEP mutase family enzyme [Planomonospora venezuelensis]GIN00141.1 phosphonomutase [Planomonospora venezuelensis]